MVARKEELSKEEALAANALDAYAEDNPRKMNDAKLAMADQADDRIHIVIDKETGAQVGAFKDRSRARAFRDRKDNDYGGYRYQLLLPGETPKGK